MEARHGVDATTPPGGFAGLDGVSTRPSPLRGTPCPAGPMIAATSSATRCDVRARDIEATKTRPWESLRHRYGAEEVGRLTSRPCRTMMTRFRDLAEARRCDDSFSDLAVLAVISRRRRWRAAAAGRGSRQGGWGGPPEDGPGVPGRLRREGLGQGRAVFLRIGRAHAAQLLGRAGFGRHQGLLRPPVRGGRD